MNKFTGSMFAAVLSCSVLSASGARADNTPETVRVTFPTTARLSTVELAACGLASSALPDGRTFDVRTAGRRCSSAALAVDAIVLDVHMNASTVVVEAVVPSAADAETVRGPIRDLSDELEGLVSPAKETPVARGSTTTWQRLGPEIVSGFGGYWAGFGIGAAIATPIGAIFGAALPSSNSGGVVFGGIGWNVLAGVGIGVGMGGGLGALIATPIFVTNAGDRHGGSGALGWATVGSFLLTSAIVVPSALAIAFNGGGPGGPLGGLSIFVCSLLCPIAGSILGYELSSNRKVTVAPSFDANARGGSVGLGARF